MRKANRLAILLAVWPAVFASAEVTWTPGGSAAGGSGLWDTVNPNFTSNGQPFTWSNGSPVPVFFPGAGGIIAFGNSPITANQGIRFDGSSNYTFAASTAAAGGTGTTTTQGTINLGTSSITVPADTAATILTKLSGTNSVNKLGDGILAFGSGANLNGNTTVSAGTLISGGGSSSVPSFSIAPGASAIINGVTTASNLFAGAGSSLAINGRMTVSNTPSNFSTAMTLNGMFSIQSGTFTGTLSGTGTFTKSSSGTVMINPSGPGATPFSGAIVATAGTGTLILGDSFTASYAPTIIVRSGNTLTASTTPMVTTTPSLGSSGVVNGNVTIIDATAPSHTSFGGGIVLADSLVHSFTVNGTLDLRGTKPLSMAFDIGTGGADVLNVTTLNANNPAGEIVHMVGTIFNSGTYTLIHTTNGLNGVYSLDSTSAGAQLLSIAPDPTGHDLQLTVTGPPTLPHGQTWAGSTAGGGGTWDLTTTSFSSGSSQTAWSNSGTAAAVFAGSGTVNVSGAIRAGGGVFLDHDSSYTFSGGTSNSLDVSGTGIFTTLASATFNVAISGTSGLLVSGNGGSVTLAAPSSYVGGTTVASGTLVVVPGGTLGASAGPLVVNDSLLLGTNQTVTSLSGTGGAKVMFTKGAALNVNSSTDSTFSGTLSGSGTLVKIGAGNLALNSNTLLSAADSPAALAVNGGSLTASAPGMSYFTALASSSAATTLSDSTITNIDVEKGALVNITGNLTIAGDAAGLITDLSADQIHVANALTITAPTLVTIDAGVLAAGDYPLFTYGSFAGAINDPNGLHIGSEFAPSATPGNSMMLYNDLLTHTIGVRVVAVPEPVGAGLMIAVVAMGALRRRRYSEISCSASSLPPTPTSSV